VAVLLEFWHCPQVGLLTNCNLHPFKWIWQLLRWARYFMFLRNLKVH
jgi:hypothetical protein